MQGRWAVVQTKPREEEIAVAHLRRQSFETFLPLLRERKGTEAKVAPMFPGYLFVSISTLCWQPIASTRGVKRVITISPERPAFLPAGWVERLRDQGVIDLFTDSLSFKKGGKAEFIAGPFEGKIGTVQWTSERRVGLLIELLGREVLVDSEPRTLKRLEPV